LQITRHSGPAAARITAQPLASLHAVRMDTLNMALEFADKNTA